MDVMDVFVTMLETLWTVVDWLKCDPRTHTSVHSFRCMHTLPQSVNPIMYTSPHLVAECSPVSGHGGEPADRRREAGWKQGRSTIKAQMRDCVRGGTEGPIPNCTIKGPPGMHRRNGPERAFPTRSIYLWIQLPMAPPHHVPLWCMSHPHLKDGGSTPPHPSSCPVQI